jgi:AsmA protein
VPSTQLTNIDCVVPAIGEATGQGTVSAAGALDFHLTAKLNSNSTVGGLANTATSAIGGIAGNFLHSTATNGVPLTVTGTTSSPVIRADLGAIVKSQTGGLLGKSNSGQKTTPGGLLGGLLGNKKPQ